MMIRLMLLVYLVAALALFVRHALAQDSAAEASHGARKATRVVLLGTGTPNAEPDRSGPAVAIVVNDTPYLVDCGAGVVRRASAAAQSGIEALSPSNLRLLFVTHLHSDHTVGFPDLILTPWVLGREAPLVVYGPPGIRAMSEQIVKAYEQDIELRIGGLEGAGTEGYKVQAYEIGPGLVYTDENVKVRAFAVSHGSWKYAFGFRFETADRTIVVSGDTIPCEDLVKEAIGCDVLVHEVYSTAAFATRSPDWQRYHASFHTSSVDLARMADRVRPGLLVLYHQLLWGATEESLLVEVKEGYRGKVISGKDLGVY